MNIIFFLGEWTCPPNVFLIVYLESSEVPGGDSVSTLSRRSGVKEIRGYHVCSR